MTIRQRWHRRQFALDAEYYGLTFEQQAAWQVRLSRYHIARSTALADRARRLHRRGRTGYFVSSALSLVSAAYFLWQVV